MTDEEFSDGRTDERLDERTLRPRSFDEFVGQRKTVDNLKVFVRAAKQRGQSLDHTLFHGPPGLGKTTLAALVAHSLGVGFRVTSGAAISKSGDLAAQLTSLRRNDVLFIDEVHRLPPAASEMLYPAMEDFAVDVMLGEGPQARALRLEIEPFTLIAATTRSGMMASPLRDRFGIILNLEYYDRESLTEIVTLGAKRLGIAPDRASAATVAAGSRGTPRIALRLLRRARDFAQNKGLPLTAEVTAEALAKMGIDDRGLDDLDRRYLDLLKNKFRGGPTGINTLAAALGEDRDLIEDYVEPFLLQRGFIGRTRQGRIIVGADGANPGPLEAAWGDVKPNPIDDAPGGGSDGGGDRTAKADGTGNDV